MTAETPPSRCVFFDRDGVVNRSPGLGKYVTSWEDFEFNPGIFETLRAVRNAGFATVLVTSQRGVARGLMTMRDLQNIHQRMQERIEAEVGGGFLDIRACTHEAGTCTCRKPSPEMILMAASEHRLDLRQSWIIGDHDRDIEMAHHAGIPASQTIRIRSEQEITYPSAYTFDSVSELAERLSQILNF